MGSNSVLNLTQPPKVLRSFQNKSQIVTAPIVVKMICGIAYHRIRPTLLARADEVIE